MRVLNKKNGNSQSICRAPNSIRGVSSLFPSFIFLSGVLLGSMASQSTCLQSTYLGNARFFTRVLFTTLVPLYPPPSQPAKRWISSLKNEESPRQTKTKERPVHELFLGANRNKSSMWIALVFPRKNTRIHLNWRNSWTLRFGPFFGLVCRGDSWLNLT